MRAVGFAALAATFWLSVATLRLMIHGQACAVPQTAVAPAPAARIEFTPPQLEIERVPIKPGPLTSADVAAGMEILQLLMTDCDDLGWKGPATIDLVIGPRGWVRSADVRGKLAGTKAGRCIEAHLYATRFPPSEGGLRTTQTFRLR